MGWRSTTLTIANGETESEELDLKENGTRQFKHIEIWGPAALTGSVNVQVAREVGGTYYPINDGFGNDQVILAAKVILVETGAGALKLVSSGAEGADRVFSIQGMTKK